MATNRDWQLGNIELPSGTDRALAVWSTGDSTPNFAVLANGAATVASLGVDNAEAAVGAVGSVVARVQIFDAAGSALGYIPVYDAIADE